MSEDDAEETFVPTPEAVVISEYGRAQMVRFGIFAGVLVLFFAVLAAFVMLGRTAWEEGLRSEVARVLADKGLRYEVRDMDVLDTLFVVSCASFRAEDADGRRVHAVIIRTATLYGPLPAVYLYEEGQRTADFVAFAALSGRAVGAVESAARNSQLAYWARRIPRLLGMSVGVEEDAAEEADTNDADEESEE